MYKNSSGPTHRVNDGVGVAGVTPDNDKVNGIIRLVGV